MVYWLIIKLARCACYLGVSKRLLTNLRLVVHCKHFFKEMQNIAQVELDDGTNNQVHNWSHVSSGIVRYLADGEIVGLNQSLIGK